MALQGTLDTFALPDVLRLLDSTNKTGCLHLTTPTGSGGVYLGEGKVVAAESSRVPADGEMVDVVFDLLRAPEGSFTFESEARPAESRSPMSVEQLLSESEAMLREWHEIEKVVPSLDCWVKLAADISGDEVVVSAPRWRTIAAVGTGTTVRRVGEVLTLGEVAVCRSVKDVVEAGLAIIDVGVPLGDRQQTVVDPPAAIVLPDDSRSDTSFEAYEDISLDSSNVRLSEEVDISDDFMADVFPGLAGRDEAVVEPDQNTGPMLADLTDDHDLARQLANLSPKAAAAVQAAASAGSDEERDAALETVDEDDDTINRGLLLKFLGSVNN